MDEQKKRGELSREAKAAGVSLNDWIKKQKKRKTKAADVTDAVIEPPTNPEAQ